jgi:hypothetical protein
MAASNQHRLSTIARISRMLVALAIVVGAVALSRTMMGCGGGGSVATNEAFTPPGAITFAGATFFGGSGDQRGTAIAINNGSIYLSGDVQPETGAASDSALVLNYAIPTTQGSVPAWSRSFAFGTDFYGIAATSEGVYADGWNYSLSTDMSVARKSKASRRSFRLMDRMARSRVAPSGRTRQTFSHTAAWNYFRQQRPPSKMDPTLFMQPAAANHAAIAPISSRSLIRPVI